ncbi:hypothetical protein H0B56_02675 [Haloechinothrix sp. YIM 98757]|uniref:Uncharacterized protein n=1 Tax=Haloechinothrix aidingensis TaxID=2752311 RepID=A0A838A858_9PSEU|nr:hypothetical protein [Haloechinothrix aidingensis]MBA0124442.1 hypothetical protein [Haloechinothrix aidingensis]
MRSGRVPAVLTAVLIAVAACGANGDDSDGPGPADSTVAGSEETAGSEQRYPDVIDVAVERNGGSFSFEVTISSPYDTAERYADGWRVKDEDGNVYGEHTLMHDHAGEQPFTRTQDGVEIPADVREVIVEGRDKRYGYGGETETVVVR